MFTTQGARELLRTTAIGPLVTHMVVGIGNTAATTADTRLDCEILRLPILTATPDYVNNVIVYKATIPAEQAIDAYELGLVNSGISPNFLITDFSEPNLWSGTVSTLNSRFSGQTLLSNPNASSAQTLAASFTTTLAEADEIVVGYFVGANVASAVIRFLSDVSNHYSYNLPVTAGYRIVRIPRSSLTITGAPQANNITSMQLVTTATAGGAGALYWDGVIGVDTADRDPDLMVRRVLAANVNKAVGVARDLEYTVTVTAT